MSKNIGRGLQPRRNWQRYADGGDQVGMAFEEGVDSYVPYAENYDNVASKNSRHYVCLRRDQSMNSKESPPHCRITDEYCGRWSA